MRAPWRVDRTPGCPGFRELKSRVGLMQVLSSYGLTRGLRVRGERLRGPCPLHGGDNPTAFSAHLGRNIWQCFTHCGGGDVVDLVRHIEGCDLSRAGQLLRALAGSSPPEVTSALRSPPPARPFRPFTHRLVLEPCSSFLQNVKGITARTARLFEAGVSATSSFLRGMVGIRQYDLTGSPLGYAGRRLDADDVRRHGKWRFARGFPKREVLYNAHRVSPNPGFGVVVVECPWAVLRLHQAGLPCGVGLLGTSLSTEQCEWLRSRARVLLLLDGDEAGRRGSQLLKEALEGFTAVEMRALSAGQEPEDLSDEALRALVLG